jgi:DNA polymerase-3 subunit gamma/tau
MLVARKAEGSMRDALSLLDQVYSFCRENLNEKEVRSVLGLVGMEVFDRVTDAVHGKDAASVLKIIQEILFQGFDLHEFILGLQEHIRNLLFARIPGALESRGLEFEPEVIQRFSESAARFSEGDLLRMSEIVRKAEQDLKWSAYPRFLAELMVLKLVFMDSTVSLESLLRMIGDDGPADQGHSIPPGNSILTDVSESKKKSNS